MVSADWIILILFIEPGQIVYIVSVKLLLITYLNLKNPDCSHSHNKHHIRMCIFQNQHIHNTSMLSQIHNKDWQEPNEEDHKAANLFSLIIQPLLL